MNQTETQAHITKLFDLLRKEIADLDIPEADGDMPICPNCKEECFNEPHLYYDQYHNIAAEMEAGGRCYDWSELYQCSNCHTWFYARASSY